MYSTSETPTLSRKESKRESKRKSKESKKDSKKELAADGDLAPAAPNSHNETPVFELMKPPPNQENK